MCFCINKPKVKIAKRDIVCYKVMVKRTLRIGDYISTKFAAPVMSMRDIYNTRDKTFNKFYDYNIVFQATRFAANKKSLRVNKLIFENNFARGFFVNEAIHSFKYNNKIYSGAQLFKCIIPKGTEYCYNNKTKQYVSTKILIKEEIKRKE